MSDLVKSDAHVPVAPETYLLFDRADDDAVIARIRGQAIKRYVYHFKMQNGPDVYGLGIDGAEACKRELARSGEVIEEDDVQVERDEPEAAYFKAKCSRWAANKDGRRIKLDSALGMKRQAKFIRRRDGTVEPDPFWFEKGCSKAIRNGILNLTPLEIQERVIEAFKKAGSVVEVKMTEETAGEMVEDAHAAFEKTPEEQERHSLIVGISALIRDEKIPKARVSKLKEVWLGDANADPLKASLDALRSLKEHLVPDVHR